MFSKLKRILSGAPSGNEEDEKSSSGKFAPKEKVPLDYRFAENFTKNGGHFLYCENKEQAFDTFSHILGEVETKAIFCPDPKIKDFLRQNQFEISDNPLESNIVCTTCEALVSYTGSIMIDNFQTGGLKTSQLPPIHVVWGFTSQIVDSLRDGMTIINAKYKEERPSICTLKGSNDPSVLQASADPNKGRILYLILMEDFKDNE